MIFELYCIKDELSEFASPLTIHTENEAKRYFRELGARTPMINNNPKDFSLWKIGKFDSDTGILTPFRPELIERAESVLKGEVKHVKSNDD